MSTSRGKKSYAATPERIAIIDQRQLTHGALIPNYVVDLYLPIIGYGGLGILAMLYRLRNNDKVIAKLREYAKAGRMGFDTFSSKLELLEECGFIKVQRPEGIDRANHLRTVIRLLDPPTAIPPQYTSLVSERTITRWLFTQDFPEVLNRTSETFEVPNRTLMEVPNRTLMEVPNRTSNHDVTSEDVTSEDVTSSGPPLAGSEAKKNLLASLIHVTRLPAQRKLRSRAQKKELEENCDLLFENSITAEDVERVGRWWFTCKLAGRDGVPPTLNQIRENLRAAEVWEREQNGRSEDGRWRAYYERELRKVLNNLDRSDSRRSVVSEVLNRLPSIKTLEGWREERERLLDAGLEVA